LARDSSNYFYLVHKGEDRFRCITTATQQAGDERTPGFLLLITEHNTILSSSPTTSPHQKLFELNHFFKSLPTSLHRKHGSMADNPSAAWPMADEALAQQILDLVQQAGHYRQLKKGVYNGKSKSSALTDSE
jgi:hypothetical protein